MPQGMLSRGRPGTGKTFPRGRDGRRGEPPVHLRRRVEPLEHVMGVDALIVVSLFRKARGLARKFAAPGQPGCCILFLDELVPSVMSRGRDRRSAAGNDGPMGMMGGRGLALNTMLNQMDSLGKHVEDRMKYKIARWLGVIRGPVPPKPVVFVIGATNRPEVLDAALVRAGRLDRKLMVYVPDGDGRRTSSALPRLKAHDPEMPVELMVSDSMDGLRSISRRSSMSPDRRAPTRAASS